MVRLWHRLPREVVGSLEVFKNHGHMALRDVVSGHGGLRLDLVILEVSCNLNDSMVLKGAEEPHLQLIITWLRKTRYSCEH